MNRCPQPEDGNDSASGRRSGSSTSPSLLEQVKARDETAWRQLARLYSPLVYSWCRQSDLSPDDARDVCQDVLFAVHRNLEGFQRRRDGSFRKWLKTITARKITDVFRKRDAQPHGRGGTDAQRLWLELPEPPDFPTVESVLTAANHTLLAALSPIRMEFEDRTWQAFWRVVVHGEPTAQVASELAMSVNAVRKAKCRVLHRLRERLAGLVE